ncbi:hypothetical protein GC175_01885 [bacterium]|nr:hypothetical protein [bacterium]
MDMQNAIILPLLVGVATVIIEYFIIAPLKASSGSVDLLSKLGGAVTVTATSIVFVVVLLIILGTGKWAGLSQIPHLTLSGNGILSNANFSFAAIIYICVVTIKISFNWDSFRYLLAFLPSTLLTLWLVAFAQNEPGVVLSFVALCAIWAITWLGYFSSPLVVHFSVIMPTALFLILSPLSSSIPTHFLLIGIMTVWSLYFVFVRVLPILSSLSSRFYMYDDWQASSLLFLALLMWPINAIILVQNDIAISLWAWIFTAIFGVAQLVWFGR